MQMQGYVFDESELFRSISRSGARALLIGRRALVALGLPVLTGDYDFWLHIDDMVAFNEALAPLELYPSCTVAAARTRGRYVLENDERVDVFVARAVNTIDGVRVVFDDVWARRRSVEVTPGVATCMPCIDDLIATKRFAARARDIEDIRLLELLREEDGE